MRYIDDVFIIWTDTKASLDAFIESLNQNRYNLKFTYNCDRQKTTFLDLNIFKDEDNYLATDLFHKTTAGNTLLHAASAHPPALICSIPYAQYTRLQRNCTHLDFQNQAKYYVHIYYPEDIASPSYGKPIT